MHEILQYLARHPGERMDIEIAKATGIALKEVRMHVSRLSQAGQVMSCSYIRFIDGKRVEGQLCRQSGYIPPTPPGRKPSGKR
jgi:DNA-binding transcriptional ArsR family regulator